MLDLLHKDQRYENFKGT